MSKMRNDETWMQGVNGTWMRRLAIKLPLLCVALSGCGGPPPETAPQLGDSYYALSVITFGADGTPEGSIKFAPSLEANATIDESLTLESTGTAPLYPAGSKDRLLNVLGKSAEIVNFLLTEEGTLEQGGEKIGFSGYGITQLRAPIIPVVSETQAYLWDDLTFKTVRWDPSTMTIDKEVEGVVSLFEGKNIGSDGMTAYWTFRSRFPIQVGTKVYETISYLDPTIQYVLPRSGMFVLDTETDKVSFVEHPTCAGLENFMLAPDGYLYISSNGYASSNYVAGVEGINPPCFVRFDPETDTFDDSFQIDFSEEGKVISGLVQHSGSSAYVRVFNESLFPSDKSLDVSKDVYRAPAWELYLIEDVANPTSLKKVDSPPTSAHLYPFEVDGHMHTANVDYSALKSSLLDMSTQPPTPGIELDGITSFAIHLQN
jgi:hypothetical protein